MTRTTLWWLPKNRACWRKESFYMWVIKAQCSAQCVCVCLTDNCWISFCVSVVDIKAMLYPRTDNIRSLWLSSLSVFAKYHTNGLTKPTLFRNKLPTQAHLLSVCVLTIHGSFLSLATFHRKPEKTSFTCLSSCTNTTEGALWLCGGFWIQNCLQSLLNECFCKPSRSHYSF